MSEPRTLDEWRRASELADAELESFDRRVAAMPDVSNAEAIVMATISGGLSRGLVIGPVERMAKRLVLTHAVEDARIGLKRAENGPAAPGGDMPALRPLGRSRWTDRLFAARWVAACTRSGEPYTYANVAPQFEWLDGVRRVDADPDYLGKLWRKHGRPDPAP